jgi:hypothetical protein
MPIINDGHISVQIDPRVNEQDISFDHLQNGVVIVRCREYEQNNDRFSNNVDPGVIYRLLSFRSFE